LAKIDPSTIRNLGHFFGEYGGVHGHRYDDLIVTKLAGSSLRERGQAGYQRRTRDDRSHAVASINNLTRSGSSLLSFSKRSIGIFPVPTRHRRKKTLPETLPKKIPV
jgi:hypothetical protein